MKNSPFGPKNETVFENRRREAIGIMNRLAIGLKVLGEYSVPREASLISISEIVDDLTGACEKAQAILERVKSEMEKK